MILNIFLICIAVLCNVFAQVSIKQASKGAFLNNSVSLLSIKTAILNPFIWLGIILYFISFVLSVFIYKKFELSIISPIMMSMIYVLIIVVSYFIFSEQISTGKIIGSLVIISGIIIMARS